MKTQRTNSQPNILRSAADERKSTATGQCPCCGETSLRFCLYTETGEAKRVDVGYCGNCGYSRHPMLHFLTL